MKKLEDVARAARANASGVRLVEVDLTEDKDVLQLVARLRTEEGRVDLLINCAGEIALGPVASASVSSLDRMYRVNVRAPYLLTQVLLPILRPGGGQIVFVNSSAGRTATANISQYSATKHALHAIANSLRQEVNAAGIRVLSVFPGRTATPMQAQVHADERKDYYPDRLMRPDDVAATIVCALQLPRSAEVTDIELRPMQKA